MRLLILIIAITVSIAVASSSSPEYIKYAGSSYSGLGYNLYFVVADQDGNSIACDGNVTLMINTQYEKTYKVSKSDFHQGNLEEFSAKENFVYSFPRIPFKDIPDHSDDDWGGIAFTPDDKT